MGQGRPGQQQFLPTSSSTKALPLRSTLVLVMVQQLVGGFLNNPYTSHEQLYRQQNGKHQQ
jgi:hypothetical protein